MGARVERSGYQVDTVMAEFIENRALPGTGIAPETFWSGLAGLLDDLAPKNRALLETREKMQSAIDAWHVARRGQPHDPAAYRAFLAHVETVCTQEVYKRQRERRRGSAA